MWGIYKFQMQTGTKSSQAKDTGKDVTQEKPGWTATTGHWLHTAAGLSPPRTGSDTSLLSLSQGSKSWAEISHQSGLVMCSFPSCQEGNQDATLSALQVRAGSFFPKPFAGQNFHGIKETFFFRVPRFPSTFHSLSCLQGFTYTLPRFPSLFSRQILLILFFFLASPGISCVTQDLSLRHANSLLQPVGSSSLIRDRSQAPCVGSVKSQPLGHQGCPPPHS